MDRSAFRNFILFSIFVAVAGWRSVQLPYASRKLASIPAPMTELKDIPPAIKPVESEITANKVVENIVPTQMGNTPDTKYYQDRITDQTFQSLLKGRFFSRNTPVGLASAKIEKVTKPELVLKTGGPNPIEHRFDLDYQPTSQVTSFRYSGFFQSQLSYYKLAEQFNWDTNAPITDRSRIGINYSEALESPLRALPVRSGRLVYSLDL